MLAIAGDREEVARFVDPEGHPLHAPGRKVDPRALVKIEPPRGRSLVVLPRGAPRPASATWMTLDNLPATVDGAWWTRHADLICCRKTGGLEWKSGEPAPEPALSPAEATGSAETTGPADAQADDAADDPAETPAPRPSFEEAFEGIVGQDTFLERVRLEADGARRLGEFKSPTRCSTVAPERARPPSRARWRPTSVQGWCVGPAPCLGTRPRC